MTYPNNKPLSLLLVGATGAVGRQVLALVLVDPRIEQVIAPTRRPLPNPAKLYNPVIDLPIYRSTEPSELEMKRFYLFNSFHH